MSETRADAITLKGTPCDVKGPRLEVGTMAPDFLLQNSNHHRDGALSRHTGLSAGNEALQR